MKRILFDSIKASGTLRIGNRRIEILTKGKKVELKIYEKDLKNAKGTITMTLKDNKLKLESSTHSLIKDPTVTTMAMEWIWYKVIYSPLRASLTRTGDVIERRRNDHSQKHYKRETACTQCRKKLTTRDTKECRMCASTIHENCRTHGVCKRACRPAAMSIWTRQENALQTDNRSGTSKMAMMMRESLKETYNSMSQSKIDEEISQEIKNLKKDPYKPKKSGENILYHDIPTL